MAIIRFHQDELARLRLNPSPWFSPGPRSLMGKITLGTPAVEVDEEDNPTGYLLMSHSTIDVWDTYLAEAFRHGWALADALDGAKYDVVVGQDEEGEDVVEQRVYDGNALISHQAAADWELFRALKWDMDRGLVDSATARERIKEYAVIIASAFPDMVDDPRLTLDDIEEDAPAPAPE